MEAGHKRNSVSARTSCAHARSAQNYDEQSAHDTSIIDTLLLAFLRARIERRDSIFARELRNAVRAEHVCSMRRGSISRARLLATMLRIFFEYVGAPNMCVFAFETFRAHYYSRVDDVINCIITVAQRMILARDWYPFLALANIRGDDDQPQRGCIRRANNQPQHTQCSCIAETFSRTEDTLQLSVEDRAYERAANTLRAKLCAIAQDPHDLARASKCQSYYQFCICTIPRIFIELSKECDARETACAIQSRGDLDHPADANAARYDHHCAIIARNHLRAMSRVCLPHVLNKIDDVTRAICGLPSREIENSMRDLVSREELIFQSREYFERESSRAYSSRGSTIGMLGLIIPIRGELVIHDTIARDIFIARDSQDLRVAFYQGPLSLEVAHCAHNIARLLCALRAVLCAKSSDEIIYNIAVTNTDVPQFYCVTPIQGIRMPFQLRSVQHVIMSCAQDTKDAIVREVILRAILGLPGRGFTAGIFAIFGDTRSRSDTYSRSDCFCAHIDIAHDIFTRSARLRAFGSIHKDVIQYCAQNRALSVRVRESCARIVRELRDYLEKEQFARDICARDESCARDTGNIRVLEGCIARAEQIAQIFIPFVE